jgi:hypothetical protein
MMTAGPARAMLMLALAALAGCATARPAPKAGPPTGELLLDMADPVIAVRIGKVPLRLRVGLVQKRLIELNPDAAERLRAKPPDRNFRFESGFEALVGREILPGIEAAAPITINGRKMLVLVASHGRECCAGVDGEIGLGLLPYASIRFVRKGAADPGHSAEFLIDDSSEHGPQSAVQIGKNRIYLQFALDRPQSVATSSAGAILAQRYGGRLGGKGSIIGAFGVTRPTTLLTLKRPADLAGFRFERLLVRTADFAGKYTFPSDPDDAEEDDIVVKKKVRQQDPWPVVMIGSDRLDACSEARYDTIARILTLRCAPGDAR